MNASSGASSRLPPLRLKSQSHALVTLEVQNPHDGNFDTLLAEKIAQAPGFFSVAPVVLDFTNSPLQANEIDLAAISERVRSYGLIPVGIQSGNPDLARRAADIGLAKIIPGETHHVGTAAESPPRPPLIIREPIRSGRSIYAAGGDLIVLASVSAGAEVLADGSIHIYGTLRGRALAGINDDQQARIFVSTLEAELVSISGYYMAAEDFLPEWRGKRTQLFLQEGYLRFGALS